MKANSPDLGPAFETDRLQQRAGQAEPQRGKNALRDPEPGLIASLSPKHRKEGEEHVIRDHKRCE